MVLQVAQPAGHRWSAAPGQLDTAVLKMFNASKRTYGSPRVHADLLDAGWTVGVNTVADSMRRQGLAGENPSTARV
jgi:putative transposase